MGLVPFGAKLDSRQRLELARVSGAAERWAFGDLKDRPRPEALAALRVDCTDPVVLGVALGAVLARIELDGFRSYGRVAELYRALGADEQVAAVNLQWQRHQPQYRGGDVPMVET